MNIVGIAGVAVCAAVIAAMLRRYHQEYAVLLSIAAGVVILLEIFASVAPAMHQIQTLFSATGLTTDYILILLKTLGISFLAQFAADSCRDAGENALASKMELAGKISIVILSLPLFEKIAETAVNLIGG
ncbi:Stage III sporulation protein AC/AD protein family protein [Caprobacter fermentans]|uniref:Stage III sporulation protein AC/AD protein family protein n=1 Tax=Caproicibacter fermentans TaxID=2576756 RepID=A0A6N8I4C8_9FIRM|nr:SpoIIIAC/SpoIIIAD family protein [Caproicibacter fermentans]MVB12991.1 Stage III sporulation protein AC/AD protein family protein [Caproicibacter fermentans]OCN02475.1 stage III sporulation protein AD [Clostridium sp. W14A]QNK41259.1 stage III sporulation protein AD [Caproicibacter fermentans]